MKKEVNRPKSRQMQYEQKDTEYVNNPNRYNASSSNWVHSISLLFLTREDRREVWTHIKKNRNENA